MKRNLVHAAFGLLMMGVFTVPLYAQWQKTAPMTGDDSKINFVKLYNNANNIFAQTWDTLNGNQMFLTTDSGAQWTKICTADSNIDIISEVMVSSSNILAGTFNGLYQSTNGGSSWTHFTQNGIPADTAIWSLTWINDTIFAGTVGDLYFSKDSGKDWTEVKSGLPGNVRINSIVARGNGIFAGSDTNGIFQSTDGPTTWTAFDNFGAATLGDTAMSIDQLVPMGNKLFAVTLNGVFVSSNSGASWTANSSTLGNINCFAVVNNQLFAGTDSSGVYRSLDSGATWVSTSSGMPSRTRIWSLTASGTSLYAGTNTGVWRTPYANMSSVKSAASQHPAFSNLQFRSLGGSHAIIEFTLSSPQTVDLAVYDLRGNQILSLVQKQCGAGLQSLPLNSRTVAPGSYIVRLKAGAAIYQQKVPLVR